MKTISIRQLHQSTGELVRSVAEEPAVITDQGKPIAVIQPFHAKDMPGTRLPAHHWDSKPRPLIQADSTQAVSDDRNR